MYSDRVVFASTLRRGTVMKERKPSRGPVGVNWAYSQLLAQAILIWGDDVGML